MGNAYSQTGEVETVAGVAAGTGSAIGDISEIAGQTEQDIFSFFSDSRRDVAEYALTSGRQAGQLAEDLVGLTQDFSRGGLKTVNNVQDNLLYTVRFGSKNVVGLIDNQADNVFDIIDSARTDLASSVQIFALITGVGLASLLILYGDQLLKRGVTLGEVSIL